MQRTSIEFTVYCELKQNITWYPHLGGDSLLLRFPDVPWDCLNTEALSAQENMTKAETVDQHDSHILEVIVLSCVLLSQRSFVFSH